MAYKPSYEEQLLSGMILRVVLGVLPLRVPCFQYSLIGVKGLGREDEDYYCETEDFRISVRNSGRIFSLEPSGNSQMLNQVSLYKMKVQD